MSKAKTRTCPNCQGALRPCGLGENCSLWGWRHETDGMHECVPVTGGPMFTFPIELGWEAATNLPMLMPGTVRP